MSRLIDAGAEMNNATDGGILASGSTLVSTVLSAIGGLRGWRAQATAGSALGTKQYAAAATTADHYWRWNFRIPSGGTPDVTTEIIQLDSSGLIPATVRLTSGASRVLQLWKEEGGPVQLGSSSAVLVEDTIYRLELGYINSTRVLTAYLNGTSFASGTVDAGASTPETVSFGGGIVTAATFDLHFDDLAINNGSGSIDNGLPGEGYYWPIWGNANGDVHDGTRAGADSGNDYGQVNENPPDDVTAYYVLDADGEMLELGSLDPVVVALAGQDIRHVAPIARHRASASASVVHNLAIKSQASGTVQSGSSITHNDSTWKTNGDTVPLVLSLVSYTDPQAGGAWTTALLGTAQLRIVVTATVTKARHVTSLYALVEYKPSAVTTALRDPILTGGIIPFLR